MWFGHSSERGGLHTRVERGESGGESSRGYFFVPLGFEELQLAIAHAMIRDQFRLERDKAGGVGVRPESLAQPSKNGVDKRAIRVSFEELFEAVDVQRSGDHEYMRVIFYRFEGGGVLKLVGGSIWKGEGVDGRFGGGGNETPGHRAKGNLA